MVNNVKFRVFVTFFSFIFLPLFHSPTINIHRYMGNHIIQIREARKSELNLDSTIHLDFELFKFALL